MHTLGIKFSHQLAALQVYRDQLAKGELFVEHFEVLAKDSEVRLLMQIQSPPKQVTVAAKVLRMIGQREAREKQYSSKAGVLLSVPITAENRDALIAFFSDNAPPSHNENRDASHSTPKASPSDSSAKDIEDFATQLSQFLQNAENGSYYQILGVLAGATPNEIRKQYQERIRIYHPDMASESLSDEEIEAMELAYQTLNEAYENLSNPTKRKIYDAISTKLGRRLGANSAQIIKFTQEYKRVNAAAIRRADELYQEARKALENANPSEAKKQLKLALDFDALHYESLILWEELKP
ncbi:MAG: J domain-containing protein [Thiopseudomonas sp.]|jgi:Tfp pilus assembly protein PilZ|nr:J domain-containing protein [Thiopseudomonas sp.]